MKAILTIIFIYLAILGGTNLSEDGATDGVRLRGRLATVSITGDFGSGKAMIRYLAPGDTTYVPLLSDSISSDTVVNVETVGLISVTLTGSSSPSLNVFISEQ